MVSLLVSWFQHTAFDFTPQVLYVPGVHPHLWVYKAMFLFNNVVLVAQVVQVSLGRVTVYDGASQYVFLAQLLFNLLSSPSVLF